MPYPNHHACRLVDPEEFEQDSFRTITREHEGKEYLVIVGRKKGEDSTSEQSYRYPKDVWSEDEARSHCENHDGQLFEPASEEEEEAKDSSNEVKQNNSMDIQTIDNAQYETQMKVSLEEQIEKIIQKPEDEVIEISIFSDIGDDVLLEKLVVSRNKFIKLHINSPGGDLFVSLAAADILKTARSHSTIYSFAASAATVVASSCVFCEIHEPAYYVIHNPWSFFVGDYREASKYAEILEMMSEDVANLYAEISKRRGKNVDAKEFRKMMDEETWLSAENCVELGLVDNIIDKEPEQKLKMNMLMRFKKVPKKLLESYYNNLRKIGG